MVTVKPIITKKHAKQGVQGPNYTLFTSSFSLFNYFVHNHCLTFSKIFQQLKRKKVGVNIFVMSCSKCAKSNQRASVISNFSSRGNTSRPH